MRILVAEDDRMLAQYLRQALTEQGHSVDVARDGEEASLLTGSEIYGLLILDIMLPKRSGLDVLREVRQRHSSTPVLLLTARDRASDKVAGLDLGADDYITKPFVLAELLARVRALGRRKSDMELMPFTCGPLRLDPRTHQAFMADREIILTAKEFALLQHLLARKGTVVTRTDIIEQVWDVNFDAFSDVVKVVISRLRRKLEAEGDPSLIQTVRGIGYILREPREDDATEK